MKRILRCLFGVTAMKLIQLKEGDCLLVTLPEGRPMSHGQLVATKEVFEHHIGKRVIVADPGFDLTVIRPPAASPGD